ncbi:hypothetical protein ABMA27_014910 [Loxostege sticticalis]|uniref:Uncharacterized protein n=1 Tax=Loxostege sticticalis TaxID=481309 RepID=A0ABR3IAM6_LOXSC
MSFSGKKFRRIGCENIETLLRQTNVSSRTAYILNAPAPVFSFTKIGEDKFLFKMVVDSTRTISHTFKLGEEFELERLDGTKAKVVYTLERDNVLNQVVRLPEGKTGYFRREFGENEAIMILRMDGAEVEGKIYYEVVE